MLRARISYYNNAVETNSFEKTGYPSFDEKFERKDVTVSAFHKQMTKITNNYDFDEGDEFIQKPLHVYDGKVLHGVYQYRIGSVNCDYVINQGHVMMMYDYYRIEPRFTSPYVNYENLHLCEGWKWRWQDEVSTQLPSEQAIVHYRVAFEMKPMCSFYGDRKYVERMRAWAKRDGLLFHSMKINNDGIFEMRIARPEYLDDLFNIDDLNHDYAEYFKAMGKEETPPNFDSLRGNTIADFIKMDLDWANPNMHIVGLLLGYPIETTISRCYRP